MIDETFNFKFNSIYDVNEKGENICNDLFSFEKLFNRMKSKYYNDFLQEFNEIK